jgi:plastocyanin
LWLESVAAVEEGLPAAKLDPVVMDQVNYEFVPHVLAVRAGQRVEFRNSDGANHGVSASSLEAKNCFNETTSPGGRYVHTFLASRHPVAIGCPIHGAMSGWVYVFDHTKFAVTDEEGRFRLPPVTPGEYTLHARHIDGGMKRAERIVLEEGECEHRIEFQASDLKGTSRPRGAR